MNKEVTSYIAASNQNHQKVLSALRKLILSLSPDIDEQFKWSRPVYAMQKDFCYLKTAKKYVTLGFFEFDKIKTNRHLIEGTGKSMRHIKLNDTKEIKELKIRNMLGEVLK